MVLGLLERLQNGGNIVIAEGYGWEFERRGMLKFGDFIPEIVLERPDSVKELHEEFALAGSDVIEAATYYGHREKMKLRGQENDLEKLNRDALRIAREVADKYDKLMAGNLSNTPLYEKGDEQSYAKCTAIFREQVEWAVEGKADYIIGETFNSYGEASLALKAIKDYGKGLPAVITMAAYFPDITTDDIPFPEACKRIEDEGAAVVGINCARGPDVMMPLIREVRKVCKGPIAAIQVPYRTTDTERTFFAVKDPKTGKRLYPENVDCVRCTRQEVIKFAEDAKAAGVQYVGLCCGNSPAFMREVAKVYGRNPPALKYQADQSKSYVFGDKAEEYGPTVLKIRKYMLGE